MAAQMVLRMRNRELFVGLERLKRNVAWSQKKRLAQAHFFTTKTRKVCTAKRRYTPSSALASVQASLVGGGGLPREQCTACGVPRGVAQVLEAWSHTAKLHKALFAWRYHRLSNAFKRWRMRCAWRRHLVITARTVAGRWCNLRLSSAWQKWRGFVEVWWPHTAEQ